MLTDQEKREIETELNHYPDRRGACIDALKIVQRNHGWVSDEHLDDIAQYLHMSREELEGVATFYNLVFRRPVGEHVILMCESVSCWITGYEQMRDHISQRLGINIGETTSDNRFTLLPMPCLGDCDHAPAMMIDNNLHDDLSKDKIDQILERYK